MEPLSFSLSLFAVLALGIMVVPGMDMAFVLSSALAQGRRAGFAAVAGLVAGCMAHVVMGSLGVGLLLGMLPGAYQLVLVAGALYVAWIGRALWQSPALLAAAPVPATRALGRTFVQAATTCLLNPKAYLFMVAVFPQFMREDGGPVALQALVLGAILVAAQVLVYGAIVLGADQVRTRVSHRAQAQALLSRTVAVLLLSTAAWTLLKAWHARG